MSRQINLLLMLFFFMGPVAAGSLCANQNAEVSGVVGEEHGFICDAVARAKWLFRQYGVNAPGKIRVEVVDKIKRPHLSAAYGVYDARRDRIEIIAYPVLKATTRGDLAFGEPVNRALYGSFIMHEVAHKVAYDQTRDHPLSYQAYEYIAYSIQLSGLPEAYRTRLLQRYDLGAFESDAEINETYLALSPESFAVKAYKHFILPGNGGRFFRYLLSGRFDQKRGY